MIINLQLVYRYILSLSKTENVFDEKKEKKKKKRMFPIARVEPTTTDV